IVIGNRHDMREAAGLFDGFDAAIADIYEARTGMKRKDIETLMDAETFLGPSEAVANGFADVVDDRNGLEKTQNAASGVGTSTRKRMDAILAKAGVPRVERRRMFAEVAGVTHDADLTATQHAGLDTAALERLIKSLSRKGSAQ
ncbi:MAG: ATP-dependent Clp protease proteolytic subunit, partial [Mesorhizobium sp.]